MARPTQIRALRNLLLDLFQPEELRMFLHLEVGEEGELLVERLPGREATPIVVAYQAALALEKLGLVDPSFFALLARDRPRRTPAIARVAALWEEPP